MRIFIAALMGAGLLALSLGAAFAAEESADAPAPDRICSTDLILPVLIEHNVDEIFAAGELQQSYIFFDYHFEKDGRYLRARAYLDGAEMVTVFGPYLSGDDLTPVSDEEFKGEVVEYLKRRYSKVEESAQDDELRTLWEWREDEKPDLSRCTPIVHDAE